ncbi:MAG: hypothetical protein ACT4QB_00410 [Gammaproteobacteria bacterium]
MVTRAQRTSRLCRRLCSAGDVRDAFGAYHFNLVKSRLTAQVNVNNILDKEYFSSIQFFGGGTLFPAEPLTLLGSVRVEF